MSFSNAHDDDENPNSFPMTNLEYAEDEYGYVDTRGKKVSKSLISQLPSHQIDKLFDDEYDELDKSSTIGRRKSFYRSSEVRKAALGSRHFNADVEKIYEVLKLEHDITEDEKIKTLRGMHQRLTTKRLVKEKLDAESRKWKKDKLLGRCIRWRLNTSMSFYRFLKWLKNLAYSCELWQAPITTIQGKFGAGVASYFLFLRWLLYINLGNFFIILCFLVTPELLYENSGKYSRSSSNKSRPAFEFHDLMTGSNWMTDTVLYYGQYTNHTISVVPGVHYNMPLAYLFVIGMNGLINLVAVTYYLTKSYQRTYIDKSGGIKNVFCTKVFCAWDYSIQAEEAAMLHKSALCNEIRELLYRMAKKRKKTAQEKSIIALMAFFVNTFSLLMIGLVGYFVYYLLQKKAFKVKIRVLEDLTLPLVVSLVSTVFFFFLKYATKFEYYLSRNLKLSFTMGRVMLLRTVVLAIIVYFWMIIFISPRDTNICYESELGKEIYRLIVINFLVVVFIFTVIGGYLRKLICTFFVKSIKLGHFDVAYNMLDLIYYQTLGWIGTFCVPLSSMLIVIILILLFYIKKNSVLTNCKPPRRLWSANESQTFFLTLTFSMFLLSCFTVGYCIFSLDPSECGPFRSYETATDVIRSLFFTKGEEQDALEIVKYLSSPGVMFAFFCAFGVCVYYARAQANAHISINEKMREHLMMEAKDKVFLLKLFEDALNVSSLENENENDPDKESTTSANRNPAKDDSTHDIILNQGYADYTNESFGNAHKTFDPGYIPANVPANKSVYGDSPNLYAHNASPLRDNNPMYSPRSPIFSVKEGISPHGKRRGLSPHQPGFRYLHQDQNYPNS